MLLTIVSAIIVLGVLIIFHEFGHFLFAKRAGIMVEEFSIGFGPKIFRLKRGDTVYRLGFIPLGGYVKLAGMEPKEVTGASYEFAAKPPIIKTCTAVAGPVFNFILSFLVFTCVTLIFGTPTIPTRIVKASSDSQIQPGDEIIKVDGKEVKVWDDIIDELTTKDSVRCVVKRDTNLIEVTLSQEVTITPFVPPILGRVARGGPAWKAGMREGDSIIRVNEAEIPDWDSLVSIIEVNPGKEVVIGWMREGNYMEGKAVPVREEVFIDGKIREIGMIHVQFKSHRKPVGIRAVKMSFIRNVSFIALTLTLFKKLLCGEISPRSLGGPVAVVKIAGQSARWGVETLIILIGFLSIQLFIFNLIPFPPLDGGIILLVLIEKIKKSPISQNTIKWIQNIGVTLLVLFLVYITINDIAKIIK